MSSRLTIYGSFTSSSSYKPMLFLSLSRLPFSFRTVNLKKGVQNEPEHLARTTEHFAGATEQERWTAREWCAWEADAISNVAKVRHYSRFREVHPEVMAYFRPEAEAALNFVDRSVKDREWLVGGQCTIADIACWGRMVFMAEGGLDINRWPHLLAWSERLKAMPGFALPYDLIPKKDQEFDPV